MFFIDFIAKIYDIFNFFKKKQPYMNNKKIQLLYKEKIVHEFTVMQTWHDYNNQRKDIVKLSEQIINFAEILEKMDIEPKKKEQIQEGIYGVGLEAEKLIVGL